MWWSWSLAPVMHTAYWFTVLSDHTMVFTYTTIPSTFIYVLVMNYDLRSTHYSDAIMGTMASRITGLTIVYSTVSSGADQRKHQNYVTGICAENSPVAGEFPAQMASDAENVSIWWRHHDDTKLQNIFTVSIFLNLIRIVINICCFQKIPLSQLSMAMLYMRW